jgi:uncharacterized membrane protein YqjE
MALIQALIAMIGRSAKKFLNAIFGWAVRALFGATSGMQQSLLTALVAIAALWPLLLVGIAAPRVSAFLLTFVPISRSVPDGAIRLVWVALTLFVPAVLGVAMALNAPRSAPRESAWKRAVRGYPLTLGISLAFWLTAVIVPVLQIRAAMRRHEQTYIPLVVGRDGYEQTADRIAEVLAACGFRISRRSPTFWMRTPLAIMRRLGGDALDVFTPNQLAYLVGPELEIVLYPSSLLIRGSVQNASTSHGLIMEALANTDAYQTTDADAQDLEKQIRRVWSVLEREPRAHVDSGWLEQRLDEIADRLRRLEAPYDEWQIIYRQTLQLGRALHGVPQLLTGIEEETMKTPERTTIEHAHAPAADLSTVQLVSEIGSKAMELVAKEIDLAKAELREDYQAELAAVKTFAAAAVAGITTLNLLLVAGVFALASYTSPLRAALYVTGLLALITLGTAVHAWRKRITEPLDATRKTVEEDVQWVKEQMA